ncbi:MAG: hypothetical protein U0174_21585 [Polyangiaceae bacterium]
MIRPRAIAMAALGYVRRNPDELVRAALNATSLRFGIPLAAMRWFAEQLPVGKKTPTDIEISSAPPALRIAATIDAMGTQVRASAAIRIEDVNITESSVRVAVRLKDVKLKLAGESDSPIATLLKSGALDLSKPGNVVKVLPKKPPGVIEAEDDRIVLDLLQVPKLANNPKFRAALRTIAPVLGVGSIETDGDHLYIRLRATPRGIPLALEAARSFRTP